MKQMTIMSIGSYIFKGTIRENLEMGRKDASEEEMWQALQQVNLAGFVQENGGLKMKLLERGSNLSGGQCQRLALAQRGRVAFAGFAAVRSRSIRRCLPAPISRF